MLKRFFVAFAGSLAAIWISGFIFFAMVIAAIAGAALSAGTDPLEVSPGSVLYLNLDGEINDRAVPGELIDELSAMEGGCVNRQGLNDITKAIIAAADDDNIEGIYIRCAGASAGISSRAEIISAIERFKNSGKWVYAYGDYIEQGDYILATTADSLYINPQGYVNVTGLSATVFFYKNLLDKIGVEAQVVKVGTYKSAVEPFIVDEMSEASRLQTKEYVNGIWNTLTPIIAENRGVTEDDVNLWADSLSVTWPTSRLVENRVVDGTLYEHEMKELLADMVDTEVEDLNLVTPSEYISLKDIFGASLSENKIAVLYAVGDIVDTGKQGISAEVMVPQILALAEDDDVKGLVLRVNSGGGSAFASEQIWEALEQFKATGKTFYVSMGDMAASGGYYISCGADKIFADRQTLTGSIGIFGIIPSAKKLLNENLGITTSVVNSNANGNFLNLDNPMTPFQRQAMQNRINNGYETFVTRCAEGRGMAVDSIKAIAEGRVWHGVKAKEIGLIDDFGTLRQVVEAMSTELMLADYAVVEYPIVSMNFWQEILMAQSNMQADALQETLGEHYKLYTTFRDINDMSPIQCRAEYIQLK